MKINNIKISWSKNGFYFNGIKHPESVNLKKNKVIAAYSYIPELDRFCDVYILEPEIHFTIMESLEQSGFIKKAIVCGADTDTAPKA